MWPQKCPVTSSKLSYLSYKIGLEMYVHKLMQRSSVTQDIKVHSKKYCARWGPFWNFPEGVRKQAEIVLFLLLTPFYFILLPSTLPRRHVGTPSSGHV